MDSLICASHKVKTYSEWLTLWLLHSKVNHKQKDSRQNGRKYLQMKQLKKD